jgi:hypothetical protein
VVRQHASVDRAMGVNTLAVPLPLSADGGLKLVMVRGLQQDA